MPNDFGDGGLCYAAAYKQTGAHRRRAQSDTQIHDHQYTKVNGMHSQPLNNRQKDGCKNENGRRHVHERTHEQE